MAEHSPTNRSLSRGVTAEGGNHDTSERPRRGALNAASAGAPMGVLLIATGAKRRRAIADALRRLGFPVLAVGSVAEVERWPRGAIVVTDYARFSRLWAEVGAAHVVVLADSAADGAAACRAGASAWLPAECSLEALSRAVTGLHDCCADASRS